MKRLILVLLCLWGVAYGQTTGYFRYDTIRMQKGGGNSELYIENATRGVTGGVLTNVGGGRTSFQVVGASPFDATVDFSVNTNPNTVGTTFSPNTPQLTTKIYVSTLNGSQWTWNGSVYVIYTSIGWSVFGNAGTDPANNALGTTDNAALKFITNNIVSGYLSSDNTAFGTGTLSNAVTMAGTTNTAIGDNALNATNNGTGNTAVGSASGVSINSGSYNTSVGLQSLNRISSGNYNIAIGNLAGQWLSTHSDRLVIGSLTTATLAEDTTKSIIYGAQDATAANQRLYFNSRVFAPYIPNTTTADAVYYDATTKEFSYGAAASGSGTVTSVSFTGGIVTVTNPTTTPAFTVAGTSGGIPYFNSASTWTTSAALAANALLIGGGAGVAPSSTTTGTGILTWLGTPSSANLRGALTDENGTGVALFDAATTPTWTTGFRIGGAAASGTFPIGNGTNYITSTLLLPNAATQYRIPYPTATNSIGESANFTYNGSTLNINQASAPALSGTVMVKNTAGLSVIQMHNTLGGTYMSWHDAADGAYRVAQNLDASANFVQYRVTGATGSPTFTEALRIANATGIVTLGAYGAGTATFDASGNISSVSDERLKTIHGRYKGGLKELMRIKPIVYKWNEKSGMEMKENYIGFSAQNIKESLGYGSYGVNKEGYLSIQDRAILATAVRAIQEQQKQIEELKEEIKSLKK